MGNEKHHWLIAGNVVAVAGKGQVGQKGLNTMVRTSTRHFTRADIAKGQEALMQRFLEETPKEQAGKIVDVFIISISHLGLMTQEEFDGPFSAPTTSAPEGDKAN